ncbi:hypothetical protein [Dyadobacter sp. CY323]|uniref:hypothetical protein n=1 Tax=Dyadobacter sp. CY323 TaxID=2907302 RepID=UPI001F421C0A|nr:hypothetical protein [Dyadobacter sp. CY323]MCE6987653.1 hypothetical protein [Dyadobacter sp. CY323]
MSTISKNESDTNLLANKVQELIEVVGKSAVDNHTSRLYQQQIADAFEKSVSADKKLAPFQQLDQENNLSREELLEGLEKLLAENQIDSTISSSYLRRNTIQKAIIFILSVILIVVGFAMIIMPAPPSFEIFTVYYFNINDGVTVMDLVSLLIIFGGILLFVLNFNKK